MTISMPRCHRGLLLAIVLLLAATTLSGCGTNEEPGNAAPLAESTSVVSPISPPPDPEQDSERHPVPEAIPFNYVTPVATISPATSGTSILNRAPLIAGTPQKAVDAGRVYLFLPFAFDGDRDRLRFSIVNKPAWAAFDTSTGKLTGGPTAAQAGTTSAIVISVTDGMATASLAPFSIRVNPVSPSTATLTWVAPAKYRDGTPMARFDGYHIYYWTDQNAARMVEVPNASVSTFIFDDLPPALWYFRVRAVLDGVESGSSAVVSKTIS